MGLHLGVLAPFSSMSSASPNQQCFAGISQQALQQGHVLCIHAPTAKYIYHQLLQDPTVLQPSNKSQTEELNPSYSTELSEQLENGSNPSETALGQVAAFEEPNRLCKAVRGDPKNVRFE